MINHKFINTKAQVHSLCVHFTLNKCTCAFVIIHVIHHDPINSINWKIDQFLGHISHKKAYFMTQSFKMLFSFEIAMSIVLSMNSHWVRWQIIFDLDLQIDKRFILHHCCVLFQTPPLQNLSSFLQPKQRMAFAKYSKQQPELHCRRKRRSQKGLVNLFDDIYFPSYVCGTSIIKLH